MGQLSLRRGEEEKGGEAVEGEKKVGTYVAEGVGLGEDACGGVPGALFGGDVVGCWRGVLV